MKGYRQGDVVLRCGAKIPNTAKKLTHRVLAEGEITGHKHQITVGDADLYDHKGTLFLRVTSETAVVTHEEHGPITLPKGDFQIIIQKEYRPGGWDRVAD